MINLDELIERGQSYKFREFYIRPDMLEAIQRYLEYGIPMGDFLTAVFSNDLSRAAAFADHWNLPNLPAYAAFLWNEVPSVCWGSEKLVDEWIARGGHHGIARTEGQPDQSSGGDDDRPSS